MKPTFDPRKMKTSALIACFVNPAALVSAAFSEDEATAMEASSPLGAALQDAIQEPFMAVATEIDRRMPVPGDES